MKRTRLRLLAAGAPILFVAACGGDESVVPPPPPPTGGNAASVVVSPSTLSFSAVEDTAQLTARVSDASGNVLSNPRIRWTTTDRSVAIVDQEGLVKATGNGTATITATSGSASGTVSAAVQQVADALVLDESDLVFSGTGEERTLTAEVTDANGNDVSGATVNWSSSDGSVVQVGNDGLVTAVGVGTAVVTAASGPVSAQATVEVLPDRDVLVALYRATGGDDWSNNINWLSREPLSKWNGIEADGEGRVRVIDLSNNRLTGSLPPELGLLATLSHLDLGENSLTGSIPAELGTAKHVEFLRLNNNELTGSIPLSLVNMQWLWELDLSHNMLEGALQPELSELGSINSINLGHNEFTGPIPPELSRLGSLSVLSLSENRFSGRIPPQLGDMERLQHLLLANNELAGPIPPEFGRLQQASRIVLAGNPISGPIPAELGDLLGLKELLLADTQITGLIPRALMRLELDLISLPRSGVCPQIDDAFQDWWRSILTRSGAQCSVEEVERLVLVAFYHSSGGDGWMDNGGWLSSQPLDTWFGVGTNGARVTHLELSGNGLAGVLPAEFINFQELRTLGLSDNPDLDGVLPFTLIRLDRLEVFRYAGTGLCRPPARPFEEWWETIPDRQGAACDNASDVRLYAPFTLTQSIQSLDDPVRLVAGRRALLRVFLQAEHDSVYYDPRVVAKVFQDGQEVHSVAIERGGWRVPAEADESDLGASWNAEIPGEFLVPGAGLVFEMDPDSLIPLADGFSRRVPEEGSMELDIVEVPPVEITVVPVLESGVTEGPLADSIADWTSGITGDGSQVGLLRWAFPFSEFHASARDLYFTDLDLVSDEGQWALVLEMESLRLLDNASGYYYGAALSPNGYVRGIARRPGWASIGKPWIAEIAHEIGHNLSLRHAPCGGAGSTDPSYPYPDGSIGAWGYDFRDGSLVSPITRRDIMGYCYNLGWLSDYYWEKVIDHRETRNRSHAADMAGRATETLLLWGGYVNGELRLQPPMWLETRPVLPVGTGQYQVRGERADGSAAFSLSFEPSEDKYGNGYFIFAVPVGFDWEDSLDRIVLSGPEGSAIFDTTDPREITLARDRGTGNVRAMLRNRNERLPRLLRDADVELFRVSGLRGVRPPR